FFFQAEDGIRDFHVTGVQTCALPISTSAGPAAGTVPADGKSLPFPPTPSAAKAGPTIAESDYKDTKPVSHLPADAPNIVVIMLRSEERREGKSGDLSGSHRSTK